MGKKMYALFEKGNTYLFPKENKQTISPAPIVSAIGAGKVLLPTFLSRKVGRTPLLKENVTSIPS